MDITKSLELDGVEVGFHAEKSDRDGNGNLIDKTYATSVRVQEIEKQAKVTKINISNIESTAANQGKEIEKINDVSQEAKRKSETATINVEECDGKIKKQEDVLNEYMASTDIAIEKLNKEVLKPIDGKDKGLFVSHAILLKACGNPELGDSAYVEAPHYIFNGAAFSASEYWGADYIGNKTAKYSDWHSDTRSAEGKFFDMETHYYEVLADVTYQLLADETVDVLKSHGHIREVEIKGYQPNAAIPFYLYMCQTKGIWYNTLATKSLAVPETIEASKVYDGDNKQSDVNAVNRINARTINSNNSSIRNVLNELVNKFNELQANVAIVGEYELKSIPSVSITDVCPDEVDDHKKFGMTFPLVFSSSN